MTNDVICYSIFIHFTSGGLVLVIAFVHVEAECLNVMMILCTCNFYLLLDHLICKHSLAYVSLHHCSKNAT